MRITSNEPMATLVLKVDISVDPQFTEADEAGEQIMDAVIDYMNAHRIAFTYKTWAASWEEA